jgi:hypothetical protein
MWHEWDTEAKYVEGFSGKPLRKDQLEDQDFDNNKSGIKEVEQKSVDWNDVVPNKNQWPSFGELLSIIHKAKNFLTGTLLHGVSK